MPKLLLFDIDGTLVLTKGAGQRALLRAGRQLFGKSFSFAVDTAGKLDPDIFKELVHSNPSLIMRGRYDAFRDLYFELVKQELYAGDTNSYRLPGVTTLLEQLSGLADVTLGLLTGNYRLSARYKLEASGINPEQFLVSVFGDEAATRPALVQVALQRYHVLMGNALFPQDVIIIGDTPRDIDCAKQNDCVAVGVSTGKYEKSVLESVGADVVLDSLSETQIFLELLGYG